MISSFVFETAVDQRHKNKKHHCRNGDTLHAHKKKNVQAASIRQRRRFSCFVSCGANVA